MKSSFNLVVLLFCLITYGHGRPSNNDEHDEIIREAKKEKYFQQYRLPYWAFVPALGVWPDPATARTGTGTAGAGVPRAPVGTVAVNLENGRVTVVDATRAPEVTTTEAAPPPPPDPQSKRRPPRPIKRTHPNTPSVGGPSSLRKTVRTGVKNATTTTTDAAAYSNAVPDAASGPGPVTKIYLKPAARAKAGDGGVALSNPISTAVVRRGDTVSIEYMPDATAEAGQGGVAISRPELVIHFVD